MRIVVDTIVSLGLSANPRNGDNLLGVQIQVDEFIRAVIHASTEADYAAFVFVLARDADAEWLHDDLTRHWSSLHDVTGDLVAIVAPDVRSSGDSPSVLTGGEGGKAALTPQLELHLPGTARTTFTQAFWREVVEDDTRAAAQRERWRTRPTLQPEAARQQRDQWSIAVRTTARAFGLSEAELPCVVVLAAWEQRAVIVPAARRFSIYQFCKILGSALDQASTELAGLNADLERLDSQFRAAVRAYRPSEADKKADIWRTRLEAMERDLLVALPDNPDLVREGQACVRSLRDGQALDPHTRATLRELWRALRPGFGHARHSDVFGLIEYLDRGALPPPKPKPDPVRFRQVRQRLEERVRTAKENISVQAIAQKAGADLLKGELAFENRELGGARWPAVSLTRPSAGPASTVAYV